MSCHIDWKSSQMKFPLVFKNLRVVSSGVNKVTDHLTALKEHAFVAVHNEGYNKVPMLQKVRSLDTSTFKLEYWRGTWRTETVEIIKRRYLDRHFT